MGLSFHGASCRFRPYRRNGFHEKARRHSINSLAKSVIRHFYDAVSRILVTAWSRLWCLRHPAIMATTTTFIWEHMCLYIMSHPYSTSCGWHILMMCWTQASTHPTNAGCARHMTIVLVILWWLIVYHDYSLEHVV